MRRRRWWWPWRPVSRRWTCPYPTSPRGNGRAGSFRGPSGPATRSTPAGRSPRSARRSRAVALPSPSGGWTCTRWTGRSAPKARSGRASSAPTTARRSPPCLSPQPRQAGLPLPPRLDGAGEGGDPAVRSQRRWPRHRRRRHRRPRPRRPLPRLSRSARPARAAGDAVARTAGSRMAEAWLLPRRPKLCLQLRSSTPPLQPQPLQPGRRPTLLRA